MYAMSNMIATTKKFHDKPRCSYKLIIYVNITRQKFAIYLILINNLVLSIKKTKNLTKIHKFKLIILIF